jgi:hypothetical protein
MLGPHEGKSVMKQLGEQGSKTPRPHILITLKLVNEASL